MEPMTMMLVASSILKAGSSIFGGISQRKINELNAFNIETESVMVKAQGAEQANMRHQQFKESISASNALFAGAFGRDSSDMSVKAFMEKERKTVGQDVKSINVMTRLNELKLKVDAAGERRAGRQAQTAGFINGATSLLSGYNAYADTKTGLHDYSSQPMQTSTMRPRASPLRK